MIFAPSDSILFACAGRLPKNTLPAAKTANAAANFLDVFILFDLLVSTLIEYSVFMNPM